MVWVGEPTIQTVAVKSKELHAPKTRRSCESEARTAGSEVPAGSITVHVELINQAPMLIVVHVFVFRNH